MWGSQVKLQIDHKPLRILSPGGAGKGSARLARLAARLQEYNYVLEFIPGWRNVQADCLSRLPLDWEWVDKDAVMRSEREGAVACVSDVVHWSLSAVTEEEWKDAMSLDDVLKGVFDLVLKGAHRESTLTMR